MKPNTTYTTTNLLKSEAFISALSFEAHYANNIKGGSQPLYYSKNLKKRVSSNINILNSAEQTFLISQIFIGKN